MDYTQLYRSIYYLTATGEDTTVLRGLLEKLSIPQTVKEELIDATQFVEKYKRNGVIVLRHLFSPQRVRESVNDIWDYILKLPYKSAIKKEIRQVWDALKDNPWRQPTKEEIAIIKKHYPMTGGFGALTLPPAFHTQGQWDARQDPVLVAVHKKLLGVDSIKVTYDRVSFKMPGQGETEFTHWDSNPWTWPDEEYEGVQGILALSETSFRAVPGTHTATFRKKFISMYPQGKRHDQYHVTANHDPLKLQDNVVEYPLSRGDFVLWSNRLLHEARINKTPFIRYAYFISYYPKGKPNPNAVRSYTKKKIDYRQERVESFQNGTNPSFFPSGTPVNLYSASVYMYNPQNLDNFCAQFNGVCTEKMYQSGKKKGQSVNVPTNYNPLALDIYHPPKLTKLGKTLL